MNAVDVDTGIRWSDIDDGGFRDLVPRTKK